MTNALKLLSDPVNQAKITAVMPANIDRPRFFELAKSVLVEKPELMQCTPQSILGAFKKCAKLGFDPGMPNEAHFVKYGDKCEFQSGYMGLIKAVKRDKSVKTIWPYAVYEGDEFYEELGSDPKLVHRPKRIPGAAITHYYALVKFVDSDPIWEVMSVAQIESHRDQYSKGQHRKDSAWQTNFDGMAKKTVLRKVVKYLPMTQDLKEYFNAEKESVETWKDEVYRPEARAALMAADDIIDPSELEIERETLKGHMAVAQREKVDVSSIVQDFNELIRSKDVGLLRAVNDQLSKHLEPIPV